MSGGEYDNNLKGALFQNNDKRPGKRDPDYRGNVEIDGVQYWMDGWENESTRGVRYISIKLKPKQASEHQGAPRNPPPRDNVRREGPPRQAAPRRADPPPKAEAATAGNTNWDEEPPF